MLLIKRIGYLSKLSFEKQLVLAVLSSERSYQEVVKVFPHFIQNETKFKEILDELWRVIVNNSNLTRDDWRKIGLELESIFEESNDRFDESINETLNVIKMTIGMIVWGDNSHRTSASCMEKAGEVISLINESESLNNALEWYDKEIEWLTRAIYLIAESENLPTSYNHFLERIPDYERAKITKTFIDIQ